jgi:two-component system sensor histidine kinase/response regulator
VPGHFDAGRLSQMLCALLMHAQRRTAPGVEVQVELLWSRGLATLRVVDTGAPIPAEALGPLLEPFRDGEPAPSAAPELYVASEIARIHGGGLSAEPAQPHGMAFSVVLPCGV